MGAGEAMAFTNRFLVYYAELKLVCVSVFVGAWVGDCPLAGFAIE